MIIKNILFPLLYCDPDSKRNQNTTEKWPVVDFSLRGKMSDIVRVLVFEVVTFGTEEKAQKLRPKTGSWFCH